MLVGALIEINGGVAQKSITICRIPRKIRAFGPFPRRRPPLLDRPNPPVLSEIVSYRMIWRRALRRRWSEVTDGSRNTDRRSRRGSRRFDGGRAAAARGISGCGL